MNDHMSQYQWDRAKPNTTPPAAAATMVAADLEFSAFQPFKCKL